MRAGAERLCRRFCVRGDGLVVIVWCKKSLSALRAAFDFRAAPTGIARCNCLCECESHGGNAPMVMIVANGEAAVTEE